MYERGNEIELPMHLIILEDVPEISQLDLGVNDFIVLRTCSGVVFVKFKLGKTLS